MTERRKKAIRQIVFGLVLLAVAGIAYWYGNRAPEIASFAECAEAGYPVMESYPRQCRTPDGGTFREDIGNELEKDELIRISEPRPNTIITSPLIVKGVARGNWFFEGSFPVFLDGHFDPRHPELINMGESVAQAKGNWMTTDFVPFEAVIVFDDKLTSASIGTGLIFLKKANPSGLPENEDELRVPVRFR